MYPDIVQSSDGPCGCLCRAHLEKWHSHVAAVQTYDDLHDATATLFSAIEAAAAAVAAAAPAPIHTLEMLGDAAAEQAST